KAVAYCASKGGVVQLTRAMALDCAPLGIRINCVCPGDTNTPMLIDEALQLSLPGDAFLKEGSNRPLGRVGNPEDIANAVWFLASPKSSFITGTTLIVDGGSLAGTQ
ncbi:MAG: SDR family oxidoreductase, partial [Lactobacillus sp.]|nr:SDR family oxidoreductase [Lactobacillus sp.]